ncbi:PepSY domain-containing protein [Roseateles sp. BYS180W]|uniref:PepSY domain-containing protein n=1 Tax=Roseateles rivi TaxID=3299028 RepID=A0ABW7FTU2_9BURK
MKHCLRSCIWALCAVAALVSLRATAHTEDDHERARAARQAGLVKPWPELQEPLLRRYPGRVLELELEQEGRRWIYEVKLLHNDGRLLKLELDARSGELLRVRERRATPRPSHAASAAGAGS